jgi:hypothetical protein
MKQSEKTKKLSSVWHWGEYYLEQADGMMHETDITALMEFREELWNFIDNLKSKWLKRKLLLKPQNRRRLQTVYDDLRQRELILAKRIVEVQKSQTILKRMESIALPEVVEGVQERAFSSWNAWPLRYSSKILTKLATARLPE